MILNWENKPDLKNHIDFSKETLVNSLNFFFNSNKNNLLINSENNSAISSIINSKALEKINNNGGIKLIYIDPPYFTEKEQLMKGKNKKDAQDIKNLNPNEMRNVAETGNESGNTSSKSIVCTAMYQTTGLQDWSKAMKIWYIYQKRY